MRKLFELDLHDYHQDDQVFERTAVRAILLDHDQIYMIKSRRFQDLKFPGGGMEANESLVDTLKREVLEESGIVIFDDIKHYGYVIEKRKSNVHPHTIFYMTSHYYLCQIKTMGKAQHLDDYEKDYGYHLVKLSLDDATTQNEDIVKKNHEEIPWIKQELYVLKMMKDEFI